MDKLLPCPFCGNKEIGLREIIGVGWIVRCAECSAEITDQMFKECAIAAWNRRDQPENRPITVEELRKMDGEPVWMRAAGTANGLGEWAICKITEKPNSWFLAFDGGNRMYGDRDSYGETWLAYRRKPEEE